MSEKKKGASYFEKTFGDNKAKRVDFKIHDTEGGNPKKEKKAYREDKSSFKDKPYKGDKDAVDFKHKKKDFKEGRKDTVEKKTWTKDKGSSTQGERFTDTKADRKEKWGKDTTRGERESRPFKPEGKKSFSADRKKEWGTSKKAESAHVEDNATQGAPKERVGFFAQQKDKPQGDRKPFGKKQERKSDFAPKVSRDKDASSIELIQKENQVFNAKVGARKSQQELASENEVPNASERVAIEQMPLNKYIAHCGLCSRRDAVEYIKQGKVKVNGELATEPGFKINDGDAVTVSGKKIFPQRNLAYILLNKPKGFITTTEDDRGRKTIMDLVNIAEGARLYPIGRLDRNTTGLIILTNDGELAQKLSHPKYNIKKVYQVTLDKNLSKTDFEKILGGLELEDGEVKVDALAILEEKNEVGIEIHSGRNRIVRRIFEHLGYSVEKLDRVMYAGLTKKNLPRGKWRLLTDREVVLLKHFKQ